MKTTKLISGVVSILVLLAFTLGYAEEKKAYVPKHDEEVYGPWVNTDYPGGWQQCQKVINYPEQFELFNKPTDKTPAYRGPYTIIDKWTDSEGNIWYKSRALCAYGIYLLQKISSSGSIYEYVSSDSDYPTEIDTNDRTYHIYYRK